MTTFYAIANNEGKYYRSYVVKRTCSGWERELVNAKIYTSKNVAQRIVTMLANWYPKKPICNVVEFVTSEVKVIEQQERVELCRQKKKEKDARREAYWKKLALVQAQKKLEEAQENYRKMMETR